MQIAHKCSVYGYEWVFFLFGIHMSASVTDFVPHWDDYLGETTEPVEDWHTGSFYQHLPPQKGTF